MSDLRVMKEYRRHNDPFKKQFCKILMLFKFFDKEILFQNKIYKDFGGKYLWVVYLIFSLILDLLQIH